MEFNMSKNAIFCIGLLLIILLASYINSREGFETNSLGRNSVNSIISSTYNELSEEIGPQPASNSSLLPDSSDSKSQPADAKNTVKPTTPNNNNNNNNNNSYSSYTAPAGDTVLYNKRHKKPSNIPKHKIPPGDEDLYILKSEIVPPVCPACPNLVSCPNNNNNNNNTNSSTPPPCPPCGRCDEPSFECKKVPNYNSNSKKMSDYLPQPVVNSFSQFGM